mmetsp:Transcript_24076/g.45755  ORF Transcript_24076/g.45755 Transcript_24076/m.45755 type:complete len:174 (+) Transcript_24076:85-606(+)
MTRSYRMNAASEKSPLMPLATLPSRHSSSQSRFAVAMTMVAVVLVVAGIRGSLHSQNFSKNALLSVLVPSYMIPFDPAVIAGYYSDPNHPHCKRIIEVAGNIASLTGTDGNPGCPPDGSGEAWTLVGKVNGNTIEVDFSPKGGPPDLKGVYAATDPAGINWPDGNKWTKIDGK